MASNPYQPPDLSSVLRTLAQFAPPTTTVRPVIDRAKARLNVDGPCSDLEEGEYDPSEITLTSPSHSRQGPDPAPIARDAVSLTAKAPLSPSPRTPPPIDPATIIDWPSGLRCVMRTVARSESTLAQIRKMIRSQHEHERQWWEGREALLKKQQGRAEGRKKLDDVLRAVGSGVARTNEIASPEDNVKEMTLYDAKVYSACKEMAVSMNTELRSLGVPFFGTKGQLVTPKGDSTIAPSSDGTSAQGNSSDKISIAELQRLQKRMLDLLEDMCKE